MNAFFRRHRRLFWVLLFIWVAILLSTLATGWNLVIVRDYQKMVELARSLTHTEGSPAPHAPWVSLVLGTLGFLAVLATMIMFFVKLLQEIKINQQQTEFLTTVTHELKTPIAALELASSLLRGGGLTEEEQGNLWKSHQVELKRLRDEVSTILEAAKMQSHGPQLQLSSIRLEQWLAEAMTRWKGILGPHAVLERTGDRLEAQVKTDPRTLNLIADNILDNARKFSKEIPRVSIHTRQNGNRWQIEITDQGWGFDPRDSRKIFQRFVRAKSGASTAIPGTGLGLHLARTAGRAMGIQLKASSPGFGRGATFLLEGKSR